MDFKKSYTEFRKIKDFLVIILNRQYNRRVFKMKSTLQG